VRKNIPAGYMAKMEQYYGEKFLAYRFWINPLDIMPNIPVFWHGNGPMIKSDKGQIANMISSPYLPLERKIISGIIKNLVSIIRKRSTF
jgi:hypothetical protein